MTKETAEQLLVAAAAVLDDARKYDEWEYVRHQPVMLALAAAVHNAEEEI